MSELKIISHRGAKGLAPENTSTSFKKSLEYPVDMVEFDVRVTKDGVAVINHNRDLADPAGNRFVIKRHSYKELKQHKPDLLKLEEVLALINGSRKLFIEVKPHVKTAPLVKILEDYKHPYVLGSFSQKVLRELQAALPDVPKVVIERWSLVRARLRARELGTDNIAMNYLWLWSGLVRMIGRSGYVLYVYTLNNPRRAKRWAKHGLAGVVTDYPDRFMKS